MTNLYRNVWSEQLKERLEAKDGYPGILKWVSDGGGRFAEFSKTYSPDGEVEGDLDYAVKIGCVFPSHPYFAVFLGWANEAADRALADERFRRASDSTTIGWMNEGSFPGNRGGVLAAACFARALRDSSELDDEALKQAADEISVSALYGGSKMWDYMAQSAYLRCVRLALVAGDVVKAQHFLQSNRRKFKHTFVHHEWLQALVSAIEAVNESGLAPEAVARFQEFFDQVRNPEAKLSSNEPGGVNLAANISLLRLELAIIKQRYILRQPLAGNWPAILALISE